MDRECAALVIWRCLAGNAASFQPTLTEKIYIFFSKYQDLADHIESTAYRNPTAAVNCYYYYYYYYYYYCYYHHHQPYY